MKSINIYDDEKFFKSYNEMPRSRDGLKAAGEWQSEKIHFKYIKENQDELFMCSMRD